MTARRTEPSRSLLRGAEYVNAASTDIRVRFAAIREQLQQQQQAMSTKNVSTLKRKAK